MPRLHRPAFRLLHLAITLIMACGSLAPLVGAAISALAAPSDTAPRQAAHPSVSVAQAAPVQAPFTGTPPSDPLPEEEVTGLRTRTSKTYATKRGYVAVIAQDSVHYQDATGAWQPIDNHLVPATTPGYAVQNTANRYTVSLPPTLTAAPVQIKNGTAAVSFALQGATGASSTTSGSTATYAGALPGVDVAYSAGNDGLKESLTLHSASAASTFTWTFAASAGLSVRASATGGLDVVDAGGSVLFHVGAPFAQDAGGTSAGWTKAATFTLGQSPAGQTLTLALDPTWLASPARQWPVVLDPSVSVNPNPDCTIRSATQANTSDCASTTLVAGYDGTTIARSLLQFAIPSTVPTNVTITDAYVQAYLSAASTSTAFSVSLYQMTRAWTTAVTWNKYDGTNAWTAAGGDYNATALATDSTVSSTALGWHYWSMTALAQGWVNGTTANQGVLLRALNETSAHTATFTSVNNCTCSQWPTLTLYYEPQMGMQPWYTLTGQGLSDRTGVSVNVANGNLLASATDLAIAGTGLPEVVGRVYNSLAFTSQNADLGNNWYTTAGRALYLDTNYGDGVVLHGDSGWAVHVHWHGSSYTAPAGLEPTWSTTRMAPTR